jgi:hypothetical protein
MTHKLVIKVILLAGVVLSTWAITTSILAHFKQKQPAELPSVDVTSSKKVVDSNEKQRSATVDAHTAKGSFRNNQWLKQFNATAEGLVLNVQAEVVINDQRSDPSASRDVSLPGEEIH